ncbi:MAG: HAD family hydrolase [Verrucomicrobiae bacterium]|nr:HAD family hydrolase [Verrucomicrobiae bacterium]
MVDLKGVVFDIDDTLYFECDYVRSGFQYVAYILEKNGFYSKDKLFNCLWIGFQSGIRGKNFDLLFKKFPVLSKYLSIQKLVGIYREHVPNIHLNVEITDIVRQFKKDNVFLGIVSDGPLVSQRAKASALGLNNIFDEVVLTDKWGRDYWKPHHRAFEFLEKKSGLLPEFMLYIGDNPKKDFITPNSRGWKTIRLKMPGQVWFEEPCGEGLFRAHHVVGSLQELREVLGSKC